MNLDNSINEAIKKVSHDAICQKIDTIAMTYKTKDGNIYSYSFLNEGESKYALVGMIDDLKREAYKHHLDEREDNGN